VCDLGVGRRGGPLSLAERQGQRRYDEHLASCDDCRTMARLNAAVEPLGDVRPGDEAIVAAAAELALSRLGRSEAPGRRRALPGLMVVVVVVLGTSAAAVAARRELGRLALTVAETLFPARSSLRSTQRTPPRVHPSNRAPRSVATVAPRPAAESGATATPQAPVSVPVPVVAVRAPVVVAVVEPRGLRRHEAPGPRSPAVPVGPTRVLPAAPPALNEVPVSIGGRTSAGESEPAEGPGRSFAARPSSASPWPSPLPSASPSAGALLASGTAARARGDRAAAVAFFRQLQVAYPAAKESEVALVSSGQLLLDGGDFSGALAAFRAYRERAPAGPLVEEALDGAARALAGLGRHSEERTVWREMVARFPGSAYVPRATQRLRVLR
jgi:hypothetical protein